MFIVVIAFTMTSNSYAQTEDKVPVPFNWNERYCNLNEDNTKYICEWNALTPYIPEPTIIPEEKEIITLPDCEFGYNEETETCLEEVIIGTENINSVFKYESETITPFETDLNRFENNPPNGVAQEEYYELLKQLATCQRGTGESAGVQSEERFTVSTTWVDPNPLFSSAFEISGNFAILKKAVEECKYQHSILEPIVLGREYLDRAAANEFQPEQVYHGDKALSEPFKFPSNRYADEESLNKAEINAKNSICEHQLYSDQFKYSVGCFEKDTVQCDGCSIQTVSIPWHKYQMFLVTEQDGQTSEPVILNKKKSQLENFVISQGGYEKAIEALKQKQHYEETDLE